LSVTRQPFLRSLRASFSLVAAAALLLGSNHCVLACFVPAPAADAPAEHAHCAAMQNSAPADEQQPSSGCDEMNCCSALSAPVALAKSPVSYDALAFTLFAHVLIGTAPAGEDHHPPVLELDTGPPERCSFAEVVLQRSILAHAPPVVA
jgi:hypothetical protein